MLCLVGNKCLTTFWVTFNGVSLRLCIPKIRTGQGFYGFAHHGGTVLFQQRVPIDEDRVGTIQSLQAAYRTVDDNHQFYSTGYTTVNMNFNRDPFLRQLGL